MKIMARIKLALNRCFDCLHLQKHCGSCWCCSFHKEEK